MPRENSFSDEDGRSLTPDLEDVAENNAHLAPPSPNGARPKSPKSPHSEKAPASPHHVGRSPADRFRAVARKVIQLHRSSSIMASRTAIGAEPGIDPRKDSAYLMWGHLRQNCEIEIVDYSSVRSTTRRISNNEFINLMTMGDERPPWSKVRWINVGGISWDVMSALAIKYEIHPLALEDLLTNRGPARSKADYYSKHLSLRVLCHTVEPDEDFSPKQMAGEEELTEEPRSNSPEPMSPEEEKLADSAAGTTVVGGSQPVSRFSTTRGTYGGSTMRKRGTTKGVSDEESAPATDSTPNSTFPKLFAKSGPPRPVGQANWQEGTVVRALKQRDRVNVRIEPMHIFLRRDGVVISVHPTPDLLFTAPIAGRLRQRDTSLRASADPSLLVHSLLDLVVDSALGVIDEYQKNILDVEKVILLRPKVSTVRRLHVLSGDLILHKRTLEPVKTLIYGLRRYDRDRCAALLDPDVAATTKVEGYMSMKTTIYLADVLDHMEHILTSLDMYEAIAENLINFTFNMVSNDMNEVMRRLTLATIIFLPLTLLTGYFGMNFENMWSIMHGHSDVVFWIIALPLMLLVLLLFLRSDVIKVIHYIKKKSFLAKTYNLYSA